MGAIKPNLKNVCFSLQMSITLRRRVRRRGPLWDFFLLLVPRMRLECDTRGFGGKTRKKQEKSKKTEKTNKKKSTAHIAKSVQDTIKASKWELLTMPPYSPDSLINTCSDRWHMTSLAESSRTIQILKIGFETFIADKPQKFYRDGTYKLPMAESRRK